MTALNSSAVSPTTDPALFANRDGEILGASLALLILPTVAVALRVLSRWMSGAGFWVRAEHASPLESSKELMRSLVG